MDFLKTLFMAGEAFAGNPAASTARERQEASRKRWVQRRAPNVALLDHNGRSLRFYDDVLKGRTVLLNVMYTVCSNSCSPATRNLLEARKLLGQTAKNMYFASMSLTPLNDTPQALREYKKLHDIDEKWTFLTGKPEQVEKVQRALGFLGDSGQDDLLGHSALAILCDERQLRWGHVNTLLSPRSIARMIRFELV